MADFCDTITNKMKDISGYHLQFDKDYHLYGFSTLFAMALVFILFGTCWNIFTYGCARFDGTAVSILTKTTRDDPLKNHNILVKIPLYIAGTIFVLPFYFLPKLVAELFVEIFWKIGNFIVNIIPNLEILFTKLHEIFDKLCAKLIKNIIYKIFDICTYFYKRIVDAYMELKYLYNIAVFVFTFVVDKSIIIKDAIVGFISNIIQVGIAVWNKMVTIFVGE